VSFSPPICENEGCNSKAQNLLSKVCYYCMMFGDEDEK
jgi:hypothetical protein